MMMTIVMAVAAPLPLPRLLGVIIPESEPREHACATLKGPANHKDRAGWDGSRRAHIRTVALPEHMVPTSRTVP